MKYDETTKRYDIEESDIEIAIPGNTDPMRPVKIAAAVILAPFVLGFIFVICLSVRDIIVNDVNKKKCTEKVDAEVVEYIESEEIKHYTDEHDRTQERTYTVYRAVFRFIYNGTEYTVESGESDRKKAYSEGQNILLMINPDDPYRVYAKEEDNYVSNFALAMACTVIPTAAAIGLLFLRGKIMRWREERRKYKEEEF